MQLSKRQRRIAAKQQETAVSAKFIQIDLLKASFVPRGMTRAFRNNKFTVMVYDDSPTTHGPAIRVMIQNHYDKPIEGHWATIQKIKNEIFGPETTAVEYYPAESDLINDHNIYWIWIFPKDILPLIKK
jgi:hypothetical protein